MLGGCSAGDRSKAAQDVATANDEVREADQSPSGTGRSVTLVAKPGQVIANGLVEGPVDPETGRRGSPALRCIMPDCPGKGRDGDPFLFVYLPVDPAPASAAEIVWPRAAKPGEQVVCPACGRPEGVGPYIPPEVQQRIAELQEELSHSRLARAAARRAGLPQPSDHRTPKTIMEEQASLPRVYLIDE